MFSFYRESYILRVIYIHREDRILMTYRYRSYSLLSLLRTRALVSSRRLNRLNKLNRFLDYLTLTLTSTRRR